MMKKIGDRPQDGDLAIFAGEQAELILCPNPDNPDPCMRVWIVFLTARNKLVCVRENELREVVRNDCN